MTGHVDLQKTSRPLIWIASLLVLLVMIAPARGDKGARGLGAADPAQSTLRAEELFRFSAEEARQAVAGNGRYVYVVDNFTIGKYERATGRRLAQWRDERPGTLEHLNSALLRDGRLYSAHSNYPTVPQLSSLEWWDPETLEHLGSVSFGQSVGSFVWIDRHDDHWWLAFVHYSGRGSPPDRGPEWSQLVKMNDAFQPVASYAFPPALVEEFRGYSASGGAWGPDGRLYVTGHDEPYLYALSLPRAGSHLVWEETIAIPAAGQGFAWDPAEPWVLYTIDRGSREVIISRLRPAGAAEVD